MLIVDALVLILAMSHQASAEGALLAMFAFRAGVTCSALLNEWGHVAVAVALGAGRRACNLRNLRGNRSLAEHALGLLPFAPEPRAELAVRILGLSAAHSSVARRGGFWVGAL